MSMQYNADEILEIALQIERNGAGFYRKAAELKQAQVSKATLLELAAMEQDHEKTFLEMRAGLSEEERREMTYDPYGELPYYLQAMADKSVFRKADDPAARLSGVESIEEILRLAIGMEKDSVVFYLGLQDLVPARLGGARVGDIVREEMEHITTLEDLLRCSTA